MQGHGQGSVSDASVSFSTAFGDAARTRGDRNPAREITKPYVCPSAPADSLRQRAGKMRPGTAAASAAADIKAL